MNAYDIAIEHAMHELQIAGARLEERFRQEGLALDDKPSTVVWAYCGEEREAIESWVNVCRIRLEYIQLAKTLAVAEQVHSERTSELAGRIRSHEQDKKDKEETIAYLAHH